MRRAPQSNEEHKEENDEEEEDDPNNSCPICLNPTDKLVHGPCSHSLCVPCMEKVLNAEAAEQRWPPQSATDIHLSAPTLGRCPICRSQLSLFDVRHSSSLEPAYPPDVDYHEDDNDNGNNNNKNIFSSLTSSLSSALSTSSMNNDNTNTTRRRSTTTRTTKNPLKDAVYIPYRGKPGQFSFHWDWNKLKTGSSSSSTEDNKQQRPFINFTESIRESPDKWKLEDGSLASRIKFMEEGCHFHQSSRTFHGKILWPKRLNGSYEWDIILGFSKDYRFLSSGRIHQKRERNVPKSNIPTEYNKEQRELCYFPMDGRWTVSWLTSMGYEKQAEIHVINNEFHQSKWPFYFNFDDPLHPSVPWPRSKHRQWVAEGVNLTTEPMGPSPGQKIRWETSDPRFPELFWTRQTRGPPPIPKVILFGMGQDKFLYQRLHAKTDDSIPKYNGSSVFGNVFTKRLYIGSASYHFLSPTNSFISYRHPACRDLPSLDDGSPLPTRVDFHNIEWDQEQRRLTATIEWEEDFGISWNDNVRWKLEMYFDSEYMVILKGGIQCEWCRERRARPRPPQPPPRHRPPPVPVYVPPTPEEEEKEPEEDPNRNEEWVMSGYGHDQVYVNAACLERYRKDRPTGEDTNQRTNEQNAGSDNPVGEDSGEDAVDFKALAKEHADRLKREGATKRSIEFLAYLFNVAADNDNTNPIDFLVH